MTVRTKQISGPMEGLRSVLKANLAFNEFIGRTTVGEAEANLTIKYWAREGLTPQAVLWPTNYESAGFTNGSYQTDTGIILQLNRQTPAADEGETEPEQAWRFLKASEAVVDGLKTDTVNRLDKINIEEVTLVTPPHKVDPEDNTKGDQAFWRVEFGILVRC